ncbi:Calx-beta domain-containing protein [Planctomycetes bacterium TBK1r]|uniref:Calx-beta domain protein n=1 Tax=Stieleria magnilauensis TaxID=2527963 RepID=A0ABX5XN74_9BACT|nr:Calx-beta domain protein [Planctomycetes bacterium TBK1r]
MQILEQRYLLAGDTNYSYGDELRNYRLAIATTEEFTAAIGGEVAALASVNALVSELNAIYESELAIHFDLVTGANTIFETSDPMDDGLDNGDLSRLINQGTGVFDTIIGPDSYDVGHILGTFGGGGTSGLAYLGVVGSSSLKGGGATVVGNISSVGSEGWNLVVAHELGHQFSARHTFNASVAGTNCNSTTYDPASAYEPASGSTIMSYAGICGANDLQSTEDPVFHSASVEDISDYITTQTGADPSSTTPLANDVPTVNAGIDYTIPAETPFALTAVGSDADPLSYSWEQLDLGTPQSLPLTDLGNGPIFRAFAPTNDPTRVFPRLDDLLNGVDTAATGEVLPSISRDLNFRATVRDGHGGVSSDDMVITVDSTSGPFAITSFNTSSILTGGSFETVTWDVAGTNAGAINVSDVAIEMSADGGLTYPYVLASATANDGTQTVTIPNVNLTSARLRVRALGNVFFDVNDANLTVTSDSGQPGVVFAQSGGDTRPFEATGPGLDDSYDLSLNGDPAGSVTIEIAADSQTLVSSDGVNFSSTLELVFDSAAAQTVHVRGISDGIEEGPHQSSIAHSVFASTSTSYPVGTALGFLRVDVIDADLPPVIGIDFDSAGNVPSNWSGASVLFNADGSNLNRDDGAATTVDVSSSISGTTWISSSGPASSTIPRHFPSLVDLDGYSYNELGNTFTSTWTGLTAGAQYGVYLFGFENRPEDYGHDVTVTGADTVSFTQTLVNGQLVINDAVGSSSNRLDDYAQVVTANASGSITITVAPAAGSRGVSLAGLAVQPIFNSMLDPSFAIAATDASKSEGDLGSIDFSFTVTRSGSTSGTTSIDYSVSGAFPQPADANDFGGAFAGGTINFADGESSKVIRVSVSGDTLVEPDENFVVTLANPVGAATITTATANGLILNDDVISSQPPVLSLPSGPVTYVEGDVAILVDSNATVSDADSPDFDGGTLTIAIAGNSTANDQLSIRNQGTGAGQIGVTGNTVSFEGVDVGTFAGGTAATPLIVSFNANSTPAAAQAILRNLQFINSSDSPSTLSRLVTVTLNDGDGNESQPTSQELAFSFVLPITGDNFTIGEAIGRDSAGNLYHAGRFAGTIDADPGVGEFLLTTPSTSEDGYIASYTPSGNLRWAHQIGSAGKETVWRMVVSGSGEVYAVGEFAEAVDFDPGPGIVNLTPVNTRDNYILKLDSDGQFVTVGQIGGDISGLSIDNNGNLLLSGGYRRTVDFDPGPGVFNLPDAGSSGNADSFFLKLDSDLNFVWAKSLDEVNYPLGRGDFSWAIAADSNGDVYAAGDFRGEVDFDPGPGVTSYVSPGSSESDAYLLKLSSAGDFVWARAWGGAAIESSSTLAIDSNDNILVGGGFGDAFSTSVGQTTDFDPGPGSFLITSNGERDAFVSKFDKDGQFIWARGIGGTYFDTPSRIAVDRQGNVSLAMRFWRTVDFDPSADVYEVEAVGINSAIWGLSDTGDFRFVAHQAADSTTSINQLMIDDAGNHLATGYFNATTDFDPGVGSFEVPESASGAFILELSLDNLPENQIVHVEGVDPVFSIAANDAQKQEGSSGTTNLTFTVTRADELVGEFSVDYAVTGVGTNPAGATDFGGAFPSGTLTFAEGEDSKSLAVAVTGDFDIEPDETFRVTLSNPSGAATIAIATANGTIINDDALPDFGDAPSPFPVTLDDDGARHIAVGPHLGPNRDSEADGVNSALANADDLANQDDEDGVDFGGAVFASTNVALTGSVEINLQNPHSTSNRLDAWLDFNQDGIWSVGEQIFTDFDLGVVAGPQTIDFAVPQDLGANVLSGTTYARFRISTVGGLSPTGQAVDGEVEDHAIEIINVAPIIVDTLVDESDGDFSTGDLSLREAVEISELNPAPDEIVFAPGLSGGTITLTGGELSASGALTVTGPGASLLTVSGGNQSRIFNFTSSADVLLDGLTLVDGHTNGSGGAIFSQGDLEIRSSVISNNTSGAGGGINHSASSKRLVIADTIIEGNTSNSSGGGLTSSGPTEISNTSITNNQAITVGGGMYSYITTTTLTNTIIDGNTSVIRSGGGVYQYLGTLNVVDSSIANNQAQGTTSGGLGGGIAVDSGTLLVRGSTIAGNTSVNKGGGIDYADRNGSSSFSVINSTISGNTTNGEGGGISVGEGNLNLTHSTVTANTAPAGFGSGIANDTRSSGRIARSFINSSIVAGNTNSDIDSINGSPASVVSQNFNLIGTGNVSSNFNMSSDTNGVVAPGLDILADNGGPTPTHALLAGSPAIDGGDTFSAEAFDQRGTGFPRLVGSNVDIGSFEASLASTFLIAAVDAVKTEGNSGTTNFFFTVTRLGETDFAATVDFSVTGEGGSPADAVDFGGAFPSGTLNFAIGETDKIITVGVSGDLVAEADEQFRTLLSNPSSGVSIGSRFALGTIQNDDAAVLTVNIADTGISESSGAAATSVTITRSSDTSGSLLVNLVSDDTTEATIQNSVTIPAGQASVTVPVTAEDDTLVDGTQVVTISATATGHAGSSDTVNVTDDEVAGFVVAETGGDAFTWSDAGSSGVDPFGNPWIASNTTTLPSWGVPGFQAGTINFVGTGSYDGFRVTFSGLPDGVTIDGNHGNTVLNKTPFSSADLWNKEVTANSVLFTSPDPVNKRLTGGERFFVSVIFTGGLDLGQLQFDVEYIDGRAPGNTEVSESGSTDDLTVALTAQPTSDVVIDVTVGDTGEVSADRNQLTFTTANWNVAQTVTLTGVDDALVDGDQTSSVTFAIDPALSSDAFDLLVEQSVSVVTLDDDSTPDPDFGDAPNTSQSGFAGNYAVTLAEDGARHEVVGPTLGINRDSELDGVHSSNADADDADDVVDDEDGVAFTNALIASTASTTTGFVDVELRNADPTSNRLDAWIDFNRDGDWDDSGEQVFTNFDLGTSNGVQTLSFTVPRDTGVNVDTESGTITYRWTGFLEDDGANPWGLDGDGILRSGEFDGTPYTFEVVIDKRATDLRTGAGTGSNLASYVPLSTTMIIGGVEANVANETFNLADDFSGNDSFSISADVTLAGTTQRISSSIVLPGSSFDLADDPSADVPPVFLPSHPISFTANGFVGNDTFTYPADAPVTSFATDGGPLTTFARFRLSTSGGLATTGPASDGEVEDHRVLIAAEPGVDFGDAPHSGQSGFTSSYPVSLADDGARHVVNGGPTLGTVIDPDLDGVNSADADSDDLVGASDDEDGVTFSSILFASGSSTSVGTVGVDLRNADPTSNRLDAWIDFNQDGDWTDPGEQIFTDFDLGTADGLQNLNFTIPRASGGAIRTGTTFARFRLSTSGNLGVTGLAGDGEVEDHAVTVVASPLTVSTLIDESDGDYSSGDLSLREAVELANLNPGPDQIGYLIGLNGTTSLTLGQLDITEDLTITGRGKTSTVVSGSGLSRVFRVFSGTDVTLSNMSIIQGATSGADANGAGIFSTGDLLLDGVQFVANNTTDGSGGGLYQRGGSLTIFNSLFGLNTVSGNGRDGGGIAVVDTDVSITSTTITENQAIGSNANGGGVSVVNGNLALTASTFDNNSAQNGGGLVFEVNLDGTTFIADVTNTTFSGNSAASIGGGITNVGGILNLRHSTVTLNSGFGGGIGFAATPSHNNFFASIIAGNFGSDINTSTGPAGPTINTLGFNLIGIGNATTGFNQPSDQVGVTAPGLDALADNGGPTMTHALLPTSPARDSGPTSSAESFDQRGSGFPRLIGTHVDVGAFEAELPTLLSIERTNAVRLEGNNGTTPFTFTVTRSGDTNGPTSVDYAVAGAGLQPANADDFGGTLPSGTISFADGESSKLITINVSGDPFVELNQGFTVTLSNPTSPAVITDAIETGIILNDDMSVVSVVPIANATEDSGLLIYQFRKTGTGPETPALTVEFELAGTATFGTDYPAATPLSVDFAAGVGTAQVSINPTTDLIVEPDESVILTMQDLATYDVSPLSSSATALILDDDSASLSIGDVAITEGDSGTTDLTFTVTLDSAVDTGLSVDFATADGTATTGDGDYVATSGTLNFTGTAGETQTINVTINGDTKVELNEAFVVDLSNLAASGRNVTVSDAQATGTINNDDGASLSIADVTQSEGADGTTIFDFIVTLDSEVDTVFNVDVATADGTATSGEDYVASSTTLAFSGSAGETQTFSVAVSGDNTVELDENFLVTLSNVTGVGVTLADAQASGTISNDDSASLSIGDVAITEGDSGTTDLTFTVTLDSAVDMGLSVDFTTADGTATTGDGDYVATSGTLNFTGTAGETQTINVSINGDTKVELNEAFVVDLSNLAASGRNVTVSDAQATGTISNDDSASLSIGNVAITEGDSGTTDVTFTVTLDSAVDTGLSVDFATADGTATTGDGDYVATSGTLNFTGTAGETQTINVTINGDTKVELNEAFVVDLSNLAASGRNVTVSDAQATGTINNDDSASLSIGDVAITEGDSGTADVTFTVTLDSAVDTGLSVDFATADGTATTGDGDYVATSGTLNFTGTAGETQSINVTINGDTKVELNEAFVVDLSNLAASGRNVTVSDAQATGTINNDDGASLSIADVTQSEGADGTTIFDFIVTLDSEVDTVFNVDVATADGTATSGEDYVASSTTLAFSGSAGETQTFSVAVSGDNTVELDENFLVTLSNVTGVGVTLADAQATGTINNDDSASLSIGDVAITEGDSGTTDVTFTVTLDSAVDTGLSVDFATADGTATTGDGDYVATSGTLNFTGTAGETQTINVTINGDTKVELNEAFVVDLSNLAASGRNVTVSDAQATGTISNDDSASLSIGDVAITEGDSGTTDVTFTVTLDSAVDTGLSVDFTTADGTATTGDGDYVATSGTLNFTGTAGETQTINVTINGDAKVELNEAFVVDLSNLAASGRNVTVTDAQATGTINNDDSASLSIGDVAITEGDSGTTDLTFTVTLDSAVDTGLSVDFATADGTATTGDGDYVATSGTLNFTGTAGETQSINVTINGDTKVELNEAFVVDLSNLAASGRNVTVSDAQATGTINNDDGASLSIADVTQSEGAEGTTIFDFIVTLDSEVDTVFNVDVATADGTATSGEDYVASSTTLAFSGSAGETQTFSVAVSGDNTVELDENFLVTLSNVTGVGVTLADAQATGTINNDDSASLSIGDVAITEGDSGTTDVTFTVTLDSAVDTGLSVDFATADGTATTGDGDYVATSGTLNFTGTAGETQTINVTINGDTKVELNEAFVVDLSNLAASGRNVTVSDAQATGTISNDDSASLSIGDVAITEGDSGTTDLTFTVTLDSAVDTGLSVDFATADGTATTGDGDYVASSGTLNFTGTAGETQTINVTINGDTKVELNETFVVELANLSASNRTVLIRDNQRIATINNDDRPTVSVAVAPNEVAENGDSPLIYTFSRDDASLPLTIGYGISGTATLGVDFSGSHDGLLSLAAGQFQTTIEVWPVDDELVEFSETVQLTILEGDYIIGTNGSAVGTIADDDFSTISMSLGPNAINEDDAGTMNFVFVRDSVDSTSPELTVKFSTTGTAESGVDYVPSAVGEITFAVGENTASVTIDPQQDPDIEPDETVILSLLPDAAYIVGAPSSLVGTIVNDDSLPKVGVEMVPGFVEDQYGTREVSFLRTGDLTVPVTIHYEVAGSASAGSDYNGLSTGSITLAAGTPSASIQYTVAADSIVEPDEDITVTILSNFAYSLDPATSSASSLILNDDISQISILGPAVAVAVTEDGAETVTFTVTRDNVSSETPALSVDFATTGSATPGVDYSMTHSGSISFPVGVEAVTVVVTPNQDDIVELDETVVLSVAPAPGGQYLVGSPNSATGVIFNDDSAAFSIDDSVVFEGNSGQVITRFTVTLNHSVDVPVSVDYATADGSATTSDNDYLNLSGSLQFDGNTSITESFNVSVVGDVFAEPDETFLVLLSNVQSSGRDVTISDGSGLGTILNDDLGLASVPVESVVYFNEDAQSELDYTPDSTGQRSIIRKIQVTFAGAVNIAPGPVQGDGFVVESSAGSRVQLEVLNSELVNGKQVVVLGFAGTTLIEAISASQAELSPMLVDGLYTLMVDGSEFGIDANGDAPGVSSIDEFHRLFGDIDGDGTVLGRDNSKFVKYRRDLRFDEIFDYDSDDETQDRDDNIEFKARFGTRLF